MKNNFTVIILLLTSYALNAQTPWLHVDGNKIKDPAGNVVILRGIATQDIKGQMTATIGLNGLIDTLTDTDNVAGNSPGWYPKVIRFTINPVTTDLDTYYTTILKPAVDYATEKGLYVIIDYHHIADVQPNVENTNAFWDFVAPKFRDYSNVLYEIYNEPINTSFTWAQFKPYMQSWINLVRKHAPHNLILAGSPVWDQRMAESVSSPFTGGNIVYVAHIYPDHFDNAWNRNQVELTAAAHPVFLSEWGFRNGATATLLKGTITDYGQPLLAWVDYLGLSWTAWCADNDWEPAMFTYSGWLLRVGEDEMGGLVKDTLYAKRNKDQPSDIACIAPYLGPDKTICGLSSLDIETGLSTNGKVFRWYKDGSLLPAETLPNLTVSEKGTYKLEVDTTTGCTMHDEIVVIDTLFKVDLGPDKALTTAITLIAGNTTDPYTYEWFKNGEAISGETTYSLEIMDTCKTTYTVSVSLAGCGAPASDNFTILCQREFYPGAPFPVPGKVEAEKCDIQNLPNLAYNDTDLSNNGGQLRTDAVDVEDCMDAGGGHNLGWIEAGEWFEYSIYVTDPGLFTASFRIASNNAAGGRLYMNVNDRINVTGSVTIPYTAGWQVWQTVTVENINLTVQDTVIRVYMQQGGFNFNYVELQKTVTGINGGTKAGSNLTLYPNPVNDILTIAGTHGEYNWSMINLVGSEVLKGKGNKADLQSLPSGLYILKVEDTNYKILKK